MEKTWTDNLFYIRATRQKMKFALWFARHSLKADIGSPEQLSRIRELVDEIVKLRGRMNKQYNRRKFDGVACYKYLQDARNQFLKLQNELDALRAQGWENKLSR